MKKIVHLTMLLSGMCLAQSKAISTKIHQEIRPDYDTASHEITTKVFAKDADHTEWIEIYRHQTTFKKFKNAADAKKEEYARAEEAGRQLLADGKIPEKMLPLLGNEPVER